MVTKHHETFFPFLGSFGFPSRSSATPQRDVIWRAFCTGEPRVAMRSEILSKGTWKGVERSGRLSGLAGREGRLAGQTGA